MTDQPCFGIDPSTRRISLGAAWSARLAWRSCELEQHDLGPVRLARAHAALTGFFAAARDELGHPDAVAVESPGGRHIHPQLQYIVGVTLAVLAAVFEAPVVMLPPATWKTRTLGRGDASKEQIRLWARRSGYVGVVQDECDALGVAVACRVLRGSGSSVAAQNTLAVG